VNRPIEDIDSDRLRWLVIGIGNDLAGADALGRRVVERLTIQVRRDVRILSVHQLTPELADQICKCERVIFVDADVSAERVAVRPLCPDSDPQPFSHLWTPQGLLALTQTTTGSVPPAWLVTLPGHEVQFGQVSDGSEGELVAEAVRLIESLIASETAGVLHLEEATRTVGSGRSK
jgi:hydrogenase maturation protease